jgi:hypothetical protein
MGDVMAKGKPFAVFLKKIAFPAFDILVCVRKHLRVSSAIPRKGDIPFLRRCKLYTPTIHHLRNQFGDERLPLSDELKYVDQCLAVRVKKLFKPPAHRSK